MKTSHLPSIALAAATLAVASPAFAQDVCGLGDGQWIGGSEASSDMTTASSHQEQMALVLGGNAYVSLFTLSGTTDVRLEAQGRGAGDPLLELLDSTGSIILSDDDSGGNGAARAETQLDAGTYCVAVKSYDGAPLTAFVRVGRSEQEALTAGAAVVVPDADTDTDTNVATGSCADARPLEGSLADGLFGTASVAENAYWSFSLSQDTALTMTAENEEADPTMTLLDADGNYINDNDDFDGLNSRLEYIDALAAGDYCIEIGALDSNDLPITVGVIEYDPVAAQLALYASGDVAPPLDGSIPFTALGSLDNRLRQDVSTTGEMTWFTVDMPEAGLMLIEAVSVGSEGDPWLVAYDDLGRKVGQNDDYGEGYDSLIAARVNAGTYLVGVRQLEEGMVGDVRMVFERYTAAR
ncbi:MAG: PPC domain-containing protein [Yoonia sp.]|uniref:PPC domain-containing protein n=1 Tax=Yoonia sp. TaxID=2212373 RepID=UPI0032667600